MHSYIVHGLILSIEYYLLTAGFAADPLALCRARSMSTSGNVIRGVDWALHGDNG